MKTQINLVPILLSVISGLMGVIAYFEIDTHTEVKALRNEMTDVRGEVTDVRVIAAGMAESITNIKETLSNKREAREVRQDEVGNEQSSVDRSNE